MFSINPLRFFRRTQAVVAEAYRGASKMGKGKKLKSSDVTADFEKFENFFYQDSHVFGIITCIADSMSESGLSFVHPDRDTSDQANNMVSEYEMDTMISELTVANMVFGNSFIVLDPTNPDFDFLEQLSPRYIAVQKDPDTGRHNGWKYNEGATVASLSREGLLHIPLNRLAGSTWGTSPLQPLTRMLDLKSNIEVNLDHLVTRYLVPRYVYLLGRQGTSVPQEVIDDFAKSLADPAAAQDQVFENNLEILTMGTQYKALHVGYILDYVHQSVYTGLAFPDSFHVAAGSTESTAKIQSEIFNKKRIGGLHKVYTDPVKQILAAIFDKEGIRYDTIPEPKWGQLSQASLESRIEYISKLAGIVDSEGNRAIDVPAIQKLVKNELGI
ncbi:MAG: hypothetical protein Q7J35_18870 [Candidatus Methanoperedens sp.]|nr:hypothetical protein [Candidatus Methanoperedens sp.]